MTDTHDNRLPFAADDPDDPIDTWITSGWINPALDAETKSSLRQIEYEMHLEDVAYTKLAQHLRTAHSVSDWELMGAGTLFNGTYSIPPINQMHVQLHGGEPERPTMWHPTDRHIVDGPNPS